MFIKQTPKRKHTLTVSFNLDREAHKAYDATIHIIPIRLWWNELQSKQVRHKSRSTDFSNNYTKKHKKLNIKFVWRMLTFWVQIYPKHSLFSKVSSSNKELCCDHNGQDLIGLNCIWHVPHVLISLFLEHMLDETISENVS